MANTNSDLLLKTLLRSLENSQLPGKIVHEIYGGLSSRGVSSDVIVSEIMRAVQNPSNSHYSNLSVIEVKNMQLTFTKEYANAMKSAR